MVKIAVIGGGNVARHLMLAFSGCSNAEAVSVNSRTLSVLPMDADLYLIAVSDLAIKEVSDRLPEIKGVVAHTSGSVGISVLKKHFQAGVFYPLQTFSRNDTVNYRQVPVFIECSSPEVSEVLYEAASLITEKVYMANSQCRRYLHLAAVFACNFTNRMFDIADSVLKKEGLDFSVLLPLVRQTVDKLERMSPHDAQTGPAARGDLGICEKHISMLNDDEETAFLYRILTESIYNSRNSE